MFLLIVQVFVVIQTRKVSIMLISKINHFISLLFSPAWFTLFIWEVLQNLKLFKQFESD